MSNILAWPWNLGLGSFKIIKNGADRYVLYKTLYRSAIILYHFRVIWRSEYCGLEIYVMGHLRSLEMAPFDSSHLSSYLSSIVTIAVILNRFLKRDIGPKNANFSYPLPLNVHDHLEPLWNFSQNFKSNCRSPWAKILPKSTSLCTGCNHITDDMRTAHAIRQT